MMPFFHKHLSIGQLLLLSRFSRVRLCATPEMAAHQASLSLGFSRQEHWSGLPFPSPMHESEKWKWSRSVVSDSSNPMDCSLPGSSVHGIFLAKVLEWAIGQQYPPNSLNSLKQYLRSACYHLIPKWFQLTFRITPLFYFQMTTKIDVNHSSFINVCCPASMPLLMYFLEWSNCLQLLISY